ncbi:HAD family hydrolase [Patescibacteria group bacterium]
MKPIKAIIFDAGGVIVEHSNQLDDFVKIFKSDDKQKLCKKINHFMGPLRKGEISEKQFWREIAISENIDPQKIPENLWAKNYDKTKIDKSIIDLISILRKNYKLILVSNTIQSHVVINKKRKLFENFDDVLNSSDLHLSKDDPEIFKLALRRNQLSARECIFVDDMEKFIKIAELLGIHGILYKDINQLKKDLISLGININ